MLNFIQTVSMPPMYIHQVCSFCLLSFQLLTLQKRLCQLLLPTTTEISIELWSELYHIAKILSVQRFSSTILEVDHNLFRKSSSKSQRRQSPIYVLKSYKNIKASKRLHQLQKQKMIMCTPFYTLGRKDWH